MTFDEWYDDPKTLETVRRESVNPNITTYGITRAAYEAGARSRDKEVERLRKGLATAGARLVDAGEDSSAVQARRALAGLEPWRRFCDREWCFPDNECAECADKNGPTA